MSLLIKALEQAERRHRQATGQAAQTLEAAADDLAGMAPVRRMPDVTVLPGRRRRTTGPGVAVPAPEPALALAIEPTAEGPDGTAPEHATQQGAGRDRDSAAAATLTDLRWRTHRRSPNYRRSQMDRRSRAHPRSRAAPRSRTDPSVADEAPFVDEPSLVDHRLPMQPRSLMRRHSPFRRHRRSPGCRRFGSTRNGSCRPRNATIGRAHHCTSVRERSTRIGRYPRGASSSRIETAAGPRRGLTVRASPDRTDRDRLALDRRHRPGGR